MPGPGVVPQQDQGRLVQRIALPELAWSACQRARPCPQGTPGHLLQLGVEERLAALCAITKPRSALPARTRSAA